MCFEGDLPRVRVARAWKPKAKDFSCGLMHLHEEQKHFFIKYHEKLVRKCQWLQTKNIQGHLIQDLSYNKQR